MPNLEIEILRGQLNAAKEDEFRKRTAHMLAVASVDTLTRMIKDLEDRQPPVEPVVEQPVNNVVPLRFSCSSQPKYDQAADIAAYKMAKTNIAMNTSGVDGPRPFGITFPMRTTLRGGGVGEINKDSFEMKVKNYESFLRGGGGLNGNGAVINIKVIKFLCETNPTDEQLAEAHAYYAAKEVRE